MASSTHAEKTTPRRRILIRTVGMSWIMILFTVAIFLVALIPYQRTQLVAEMDQRARVVFTSIAQVTMESILLEDLGAVVEHCLSVVSQNPSLSYLVLTRKDGFSLVHTRDAWKQVALDGLWTPAPQTPIGRGRFMSNPLGGGQVFHTSYRFEYMGINWGWIHLGLTTDKYRQDSVALYRRSFMMAALAISAGFILSLFYARRLSVPILQLETFTRRIAAGHLDERIKIQSGDEVEQLAESFNHMVGELQRANEEREATQQKLVDTARQAGMAETVINVLHNVGNVVNSVGVTTATMKRRIERTRLESLNRLAALMETHKRDLARYLTEDPRGRKVPSYLGALCDHLATEQKNLLSDLTGLDRHVEHIRDIIHLQQDYSRSAGVVESVGIHEVIDDALQINAELNAKYDIVIHREVEDLPACWADRHKLMQILINLIANARQALIQSSADPKMIRIRLRKNTDDRIRISVIDNGVGIALDNRTRIFQHGFTTRADGHGFGLHSSAIAAREMEGSLTADSDGPGKGAAFTLELPYRPMETSGDTSHTS
jgi:signal transduction histidine kinase